MQITIENIQNLNFESITLPTNAFLVSEKVRYTPNLIRSMFPNAKKIFVLDFSVLFEDSEAIPILGNSNEMLGLRDVEGVPIINIDHHSNHADFIRNISTTNQALISNNVIGLIPTEKDVVIVNHLDTDSVLSLIALTNPNMSRSIKLTFAHAAIAADHTGEFSPLISLIDAMYDERNLEMTLNIVLQFLTEGKIGSLEVSIQEKFDLEVLKRKRSVEIIRDGLYTDVGNAVILIELNEEKSLQTIPFLSILEDFGVKAKVVIISNPVNGKFKLNVRAGRDFSKRITLQTIADSLHLERFGYGGRAHAGGNERFLEQAEFITPIDFARLISSYFEK